MSMLERIRQVNATGAFNRWAGIEVVSAGDGHVELHLRWRDDLGQYAGFLHASLIGGLIDTACGFAAATVSGPVLVSHFSVNCMVPAVGSAFRARGRVVRAGRKQIFAAADLYAVTPEGDRLVANGEAVLVPVETRQATGAG